MLPSLQNDTSNRGKKSPKAEVGKNIFFCWYIILYTQIDMLSTFPLKQVFFIYWRTVGKDMDSMFASIYKS